MAPEQAKGKAVDKRVDIWAFWCVLFEMLTGERAFPGDDVTDFIVSVMTKEPDWTKLPPSMPPRVVDLLQRCLKKDSRERLRDIGDARIELDFRDRHPPVVGPHRPRPIRTVLLGFAVILSAIGGAYVHSFLAQTVPVVAPVTRAAIPIPAATPIPFSDQPAVAISPDGTRLVYVALVGSTTQLFARPMEQETAVPLAGTEGASGPFFSPDGQWVGFFSRDRLLKTPFTGGTPATICEVEPRAVRGASWGDDGSIVWATPSAILKVPGSGGRARPLAVHGAVEGGRDGFIWPQVLPPVT